MNKSQESRRYSAVARQTVDLIVDACVVIEGVLFPDMKDERITLEEVHSRLLSWIKLNVMGDTQPVTDGAGNYSDESGESSPANHKSQLRQARREPEQSGSIGSKVPDAFAPPTPSGEPVFATENAETDAAIIKTLLATRDMLSQENGELFAMLERERADIERLRAQVTELERDAARLDWLDTLTKRTQFQNARVPNHVRDLVGNVSQYGEGGGVRAAIDKAREGA